MPLQADAGPGYEQVGQGKGLLFFLGQLSFSVMSPQVQPSCPSCESQAPCNRELVAGRPYHTHGPAFIEALLQCLNLLSGILLGAKDPHHQVPVTAPLTLPGNNLPGTPGSP